MSSPPSSSPQDPDQVDNSPCPPSTHKWNHFEVRTLVCLIIKGEHLASDDPMHIADTLNNALNPASCRNSPNYSRDIPHDDIQNMLNRILTKKMHAVDVVGRTSQPIVTRTKVNAFMRSLGFDGSKEEWAAGRKEMIDVEGDKRHRRYMARKDRRDLSPRARDQRHRRKMMVREPRARRLLRGWGIGASFWEGDVENADRPTTRSRCRESTFSGSAVTTSSTSGRMSYITDISSALPTGKTSNSSSARTPNPAVGAWGGGFGPGPVPKPMGFTPLSSSIMPPLMTPAGLQQPYHSNGLNDSNGPSGSGI